MNRNPQCVLISVSAAALIGCAPAFAEQPSFTKGAAKVIHNGLIECGGRARPSRVGEIISEDGKTWIVPAETAFETGPKAPDMQNGCGGEKHRSLSDINLTSLPIMDAGGNEVFTAYIFADNYFELYVNGTLVGVDPVPFTPFNSNVIRFKAERPVTLAFKLVDWEENLGLGSEDNRGSLYHPGDGGLVATFTDASGDIVKVTDGSWKAQTFYIAPLPNRDCLKVSGQMRDSSACSTKGPRDGSAYSAAHWSIPTNWAAADFDASAWPDATVFTNRTVGVDNKRSYTDFEDIFDARSIDARFIWSTNLVLDNLVLVQGKIQ